jgi:hypothetical protein
MELALAILNLLNVASPGIAQLVLLVKQKDGTIGVVQMLDQADAQFDANMKQASDWLAEHAKKA